MMNRELYFATPIYIADVGTPEFNTHLEKNIINWANLDKGIVRTNMKSWHSPDDMHKKNEYKDLTVKSQLEQKKSKIDYDRVNYVFQNTNNKITSMRINKPTNQQPIRNNTAFLNKLNKKR